MTLDQYLADRCISAAEFGRKIGLTRQTIMVYRRGERLPRGEHMRRIEAETAGAVTANDFMSALRSSEEVTA